MEVTSIISLKVFNIDMKNLKFPKRFNVVYERPPPRVNLPKLRQSTTRIVKGGQYISCSGSSMSKNLTKVEKFGFFLAFIITEKTKIKLIKLI